jgi:hypothetical protein
MTIAAAAIVLRIPARVKKPVVVFWKPTALVRQTAAPAVSNR